MALPVLDAVFASSADLPRKQMLAKWLVEQTGSGSVDDFLTLPERYLYAKIAVSLGGPRTEQQYIDLPKNYVWNDIYNATIFNRTAPPAPSNLTLTPLSSSSIKLDWVTNGASVAYSVERSVDGGTFQVIGTTAVGATTATNTGLNIASNYQYRIRGSSGGFFTGYSNTASASTYDANASSFVATSGATDVVAINDFVLGVKALGLWNSMVCWPLRSTQNAGTGTTAYSLGGLGTYNGTLVNGPTWGADGITFTRASSHRITALSPITNAPATLIAWAKVSGLTTNQEIISASNPNGQGWFFLRYEGGAPSKASLAQAGTNSIVIAATSSSALPINTFAMLAGTYAGNSPMTAAHYRNATADGTASANFTPSGVSAVTMGGLTALTNSVFNQYDGTAAGTAIFNTDLSANTISALHSLYKQALGTGLGLP